jgi:hypothetical protein
MEDQELPFMWPLSSPCLAYVILPGAYVHANFAVWVIRTCKLFYQVKVTTHGEYIQALNLFRILIHCSELIADFVGRKPTNRAA